MRTGPHPKAGAGCDFYKSVGVCAGYEALPAKAGINGPEVLFSPETELISTKLMRNMGSGPWTPEYCLVRAT